MVVCTPETAVVDVLVELAETAEPSARRQILVRHPELACRDEVARISDRAAELLMSDVEKGERLAQVASWLAEDLDDDFCRGHARRALGNVAFVRGMHTEAIEQYKAAEHLFLALDCQVELGRTLSTSLQSLIFLAQYDEAFEAVKQAQAIFERLGDGRRLSRLSANLGNILYRLDRFQEAYDTYCCACEGLRKLDGEEIALGSVLHNLAVCLTSLNRFPEALEVYQEARDHCERHGLALLRAQADYNIAYLHYLGGDYTRAIELYSATRRLCDQIDDRYHKALCDLDQSEMYLEIDMVQEGGQLAEQAFAGFEEMGIGYEAAKALVNLAVATFRQKNAIGALEILGKAWQRFVRERNSVWPGLIDLYRALILTEEGRLFEALPAVEAASAFLSNLPYTGKAILCELLRARLELGTGQALKARTTCLAAIERMAATEDSMAELPAVALQAHFTLGQIEHALGERAAAYAAYRRSQAGLESLRCQLSREELKIPFLKDRLLIYENLVWMCLTQDPSPARRAQAFAFVEQAKSRRLSDLLVVRGHALPAPGRARSDLVEKVLGLREELNWYSRQVDVDSIRDEKRSAEHIEPLRARTRRCEDELVRALGELGGTGNDFAALQVASTLGLESIRAALPEDTLLLEYYQGHETLLAFVLGRRSLDVVPLTPVSRVEKLLKLLGAQLSRCRSADDSGQKVAATAPEATQAHLRSLYSELVEPLARLLVARRLVIVPHGVLYQVPFHALHSGRSYLSERFSISYAPSATVYAQSVARTAESNGFSLVLEAREGSEAAATEARAVASALPSPLLLAGEEATAEALRTHAPDCRFLHIAGRGLVHRANPLFSAIPLADGPITVFDLLHLGLSAELVTLSGRGPGPIGSGDDSLGLARGLLYAGAQAVQLMFWDVEGPSTAEFMQAFYAGVSAGYDKADAMREAMAEIRKRYPHPYYWAPFMLIGRHQPQ